jgi:hypothetical protein
MSLNQVNWVELLPCISADQAALEAHSMIAPVNRQNILLNAIRNLLSQDNTLRLFPTYTDLLRIAPPFNPAILYHVPDPSAIFVQSLSHSTE